MENLSAYSEKPGTLVPVFTAEVQTLPEDTGRILDEVMKVHPLSFGRYQVVEVASLVFNAIRMAQESV